MGPAGALPTRRPLRQRPAAIATAIVTVLALLCCGGGVTAFLVGGLGEEDDILNAAMGCGGTPLDPDSKLPRMVDYSPIQVRNAALIINAGAEMELGPRAWVIAVATAMQESGLRVYANDNPRYPEVRRISMALPHQAVGRDHDSVGLFQQRPIEGDGSWGTVEELMNPPVSARKFYQALIKIEGWEKLPLTVAAQQVQKSAYPDAYAKHETVATEFVNLLADGAARMPIGGALTKAVCARAGQIAASGWTVPIPGSVGSGFRTASRPTHHGVDIMAARYTPIWAATSGVVSIVECDEDFRGRQTCNTDGWPGKGGCGWMVEIVHADNVMTRYCHMVQRPFVKVGQQVAAGDVIGRVGTSGNSSGPHLHFEVHLSNDRTSLGAVDPARFMRERGAPFGGDE